MIVFAARNFLEISEQIQTKTGRQAEVYPASEDWRVKNAKILKRLVNFGRICLGRSCLESNQRHQTIQS